MSDAADIEASLRAIEPGWRFVRSRDLAQLLRWLRDRGDRISPDVDRAIAVSKLDAEASGCFPDSTFADAPADLLLATYPTERGISDLPGPRQLVHYWRRLYSHRLPTAGAMAVWQSLPIVLRRDAEALLRATDAIRPDATDAELASAFATDLLSHARFAPGEAEYRYPGFVDADAMRSRFCEGFDEAAVYAATRPKGAAEPHDRAEDERVTVPARALSDAANARTAEQARDRGNFARAAILFTVAGDDRAADEALRLGIVKRLAPILNWDADRRAAWLGALRALLAPATGGRWSTPAKALYDLQKIAVDLQGDLSAVDPWGWLTSFGRRPIIRKLTLARRALVLRRLLKVRKHLLHSHSPPARTSSVLGLLEADIHTAELALRTALGPILGHVLRDVGFVPGNVVEEIALRKIVAELLDATAANGHIRLGDLRDTLARNRLKMPDLAGPGQFFRGDALLKADRKLGDALDGIYYHGEIYLRWFQRGSALAFGTKAGRWFSLVVAAPFGAAFMTVEFAKYMVHEVSSIMRFFSGLFDSALAALHAEQHAHKSHGIAMSPEAIATVVALGILYLGLIHSKAMRDVALRLLGDLGRGIGWLFGTLPGLVWNCQTMRTFRRNRAVRWFNRRLAVPLAGAAMAALVVAQFDFPVEEFWSEVVGTFAALALLLNTTPGQRIQERAGDALAWTWRQIRTNFFPGLIGWIAWFFRTLLGALDRLIYTVDEWLHFRSGRSKSSLVLLIALAAIWFPVRYALRFAIHLLIEPQINPIKHFPVVTVSHKLLLPMIPGTSAATGIHKQWVTLALSGVPGIFGFLAWELRENWRLYAANRPDRLKPLALGHHGESMRGLLRHGFHSGTIPKAHASIRKALAKAEVRGGRADIHKPLKVLHHVEEALRHFAERELVAQLHTTAAWAVVPLRCGGVTLGLQHVRIEILGGGVPALIFFELIDSQIRVECDDGELLKGTNDAQRECWNRAVLGFAAMGAAPCDDPRLKWDEWVRFWEAVRSGS